MLSENLKNLRKAKGLSQEELAARLHVVRQTISKWEKGLSVPDSEMLIRLAEALDTTVQTLLGETVPPEEETESLKAIAAKLETLNEQFARQNERRRKLRQVFFIVVGVISALVLLAALAAHLSMAAATSDAVFTIGGADGPTAVFVARAPSYHTPVILAGIAAVGSAIGLCLNRRRP